MNIPAFIYAARASKAVKIGYTTQPRRRLAYLQQALPKPLIAAVCVEVPHDQKELFEKRLHEQFKRRKVRGEWFRISMDDASAALAELGPLLYPLADDWRDPEIPSGKRLWRTFDPVDAERTAALIRTLVNIEKTSRRSKTPFTEIYWNANGKGYRRAVTWNYP